MRSNRERSVGGSLMLSITDKRGLYRLSTGLADARMAVRALRVHIIPAFAIDTCLDFQRHLIQPAKRGTPQCSIITNIAVVAGSSVGYGAAVKEICRPLLTATSRGHQGCCICHTDTRREDKHSHLRGKTQLNLHPQLNPDHQE